MPEPYDTYRVDIWISLNELSAGMNNWRQEFVNLGAQIAANNWPAAQASCNTLSDEFSTYVRAKLCDSGGFKGKLNTALKWIGTNWDGDGGCTMDDILNEMLSATFEQLTSWMGITQAYKVAVWDAPFNEEYYAALARGFRSWGI